MPRRGVTLGDKEALSGLAASWDKSRAIRGHLLKTGNLLRWPSPAQVGCINFETLGLNYRVMTKLLRIWLPKIDTLKTVNIFACRHEAGFLIIYSSVNELGLGIHCLILVPEDCPASLGSQLAGRSSEDRLRCEQCQGLHELHDKAARWVDSKGAWVAFGFDGSSIRFLGATSSWGAFDLFIEIDLIGDFLAFSPIPKVTNFGFWVGVGACRNYLGIGVSVLKSVAISLVV